MAEVTALNVSVDRIATATETIALKLANPGLPAGAIGATDADALQARLDSAATRLEGLATTP